MVEGKCEDEDDCLAQAISYLMEEDAVIKNS